MAIGTEPEKTEEERRRRPVEAFSMRQMLHTSSQIGWAVLSFILLGWLIWRGAMAMEYNWQWYRVSPFFYKVVDGEFIWGPLFWVL